MIMSCNHSTWNIVYSIALQEKSDKDCVRIIQSHYVILSGSQLNARYIILLKHIYVVLTACFETR